MQQDFHWKVESHMGFAHEGSLYLPNLAFNAASKFFLLNTQVLTCTDSTLKVLTNTILIRKHSWVSDIYSFQELVINTVMIFFFETATSSLFTATYTSIYMAFWGKKNKTPKLSWSVVCNFFWTRLLWTTVILTGNIHWFLFFLIYPTFNWKSNNKITLNYLKTIMNF